MARPVSNEVERFLSKVQPVKSGCIEWQAERNRGGYGKLWFRGKPSQSAHRVSYQLFACEIPDGRHVLHRCDNRKCVNVDHLFLGDAMANIADMDAKGRRGTKSSLTYENVAQIKLLLSAGQSQERVAQRFGVDQTTISKIHIGKTTKFKEN